MSNNSKVIKDLVNVRQQLLREQDAHVQQKMTQDIVGSISQNTSHLVKQEHHPKFDLQPQPEPPPLLLLVVDNAEQQRRAADVAPGQLDQMAIAGSMVDK